MSTISGYDIIKILKTEGNRSTCHAVKVEQGIHVYLHIITSIDSKKHAEQLQAEYDLICQIDAKGILQGLDIVVENEATAIVIKGVEGQLLSEYVKTRELTTHQFLNLAIQLTDILGDLNRHNIEHHNISPDNFIIDQKEQVFLIDLQYARLNGAQQYQAIPRESIKHLRYISPEQTGRTNRKVDFRTDIYSLGVVFYQLLTGRLPYETDDLAALVHAHIAKVPKQPRELKKHIPEVLGSIVLKMMEKSPESRYQSAIGLKHDLQYCQRLWLESGKIDSFELGSNDVSDLFEIPNKLYGRADEIEALHTAWKQANNGAAKLLMVSGFSGIGKSALIQEIESTVLLEGGFFVQGKFDQFTRDSPYVAGIQAFQQLIRHILSKKDEDIEYWKLRFIKALGNNLGVISEVLPELELITGPPPKVLVLLPSEALNRFNLAFIQFFQAITDRKHPLVLVLDDLQWVDLPTLKLIELVMLDDETNSLLMIGAYRDDEVDEGHLLMNTVKNLSSRKEDIIELKLGPLNYNEINELVADTLKENQSNTKQLSELILKKTGGNPFFTNVFLTALYREKLIQFNFDIGKWEWDLVKIEGQNITENVVGLMSNRIKLLDDKTQWLLEVAACIGNKFDLFTLATVYEHTPDETALDLGPAIEQELVLESFNQYAHQQLSRDSYNREYEFLHDRVQQAAYNLIEEGAKHRVHLSIARLLNNGLQTIEKKERIFDIVGQYNSGLELISDPDERLKVAQLNLEAGKKAKISAAFDIAYRYYNHGISLLPKNNWNKQYDLSLELYSEGAEAAYLSNDINAMERLTSTVLIHAKRNLDKVKAYGIRIQAYVSISKNEKALQESLEALSMLGFKFPKNPNQVNIIMSLVRTKFKLMGKSMERLLTLPTMTDDRISATMEILSYAMSPAYFTKPNLFPLFVFKQINLSNSYGNHTHTAFAYSTYGLILCGSTNEFDQGQAYGNLALKLKDKFNARFLSGKLAFLRTSFILHWKHPYRDTHAESKEGQQVAFETGDFLYGAYNIFHQGTTSLYMGMPLSELRKSLDIDITKLVKTKQDLVFNWLNVYRQTVENLMRDIPLQNKLTGDCMQESQVIEKMKSGQDNSGLFVLYMYKMILSYHMCKLDEALINSDLAEVLLPNVLGTPHTPIFAFYYALLIAKTESLNKTKKINKIKKELKKLKTWSKSCSENYRHKFIMLKASLLQVQGKSEVAISLLHEGIQEANNNNFINDAALGHELLSEWTYKKGDLVEYEKNIRKARGLYLKWGALSIVKLLDESHECLNAQGPNNDGEHSEETNTVVHHSNTTTDGSNLDVLSMTKASLAIAGEIHLDRLVEKLMQVVIESACAQEGFLIIPKEENWIVQAEGSIEQEGIDEDHGLTVAQHRSIVEPIVLYVERTKEPLILDDVQKDKRFALDPIVALENVRSVCCIPIINQGRLIGILYLDNNLQTGVFTEKRVAFLGMLSGQIAVSLENALLYQNLEQKVQERTLEIQLEKEKVDKLLLNILPSQTAHELKTFGVAKPRSFDQVTVMFTDFANFSAICKDLSADELVECINTYYSHFDSLMEKHGLEKIKTIGDSYMCVGGLPTSNDTHAFNVIDAAKDIQTFVNQQMENNKGTNNTSFECRIGIHTGPVIAGIVGTKKFAYDIWGDTVNIASRLESNGASGKVNISQSTYDIVKDKYECKHRGIITIKNRGEIDMYFVN